jgi:hypothetical protein
MTKINAGIREKMSRTGEGLDEEGQHEYDNAWGVYVSSLLCMPSTDHYDL